jgi:hypothetical protein
VRYHFISFKNCYIINPLLAYPHCLNIASISSPVPVFTFVSGTLNHVNATKNAVIDAKITKT